MTQIQHTPLPYRIKDKEGKYLGRKTKWEAVCDTANLTSSFPIMAGKKTLALLVSAKYDDSEMEGTGAFMVQACNAHYDLIEALKKARHVYFTHGVNPAEIDALLKQVEGE